MDQPTVPSDDAANVSQDNRSASAKANDGSITSAVNDSYFPTSKSSTLDPVPITYSNIAQLEKSDYSLNPEGDFNNEIQQNMRTVIEVSKHPAIPGHPTTPVTAYTTDTLPSSRKTSVHFINDEAPLANGEDQHSSSPPSTTLDQTRRRLSEVRASSEPVIASDEKRFILPLKSTTIQGNESSSSDDYFGMQPTSPRKDNLQKTEKSLEDGKQQSSTGSGLNESTHFETTTKQRTLSAASKKSLQIDAESTQLIENRSISPKSTNDVQSRGVFEISTNASPINVEDRTSPQLSSTQHPISPASDDQTIYAQQNNASSGGSTPQLKEEPITTNLSHPKSATEQRNKVPSRATSPQQTNDESTIRSDPQSVADEDPHKTRPPTVSPQQASDEVLATSNRSRPESGVDNETLKTPSHVTNPQQQEPDRISYASQRTEFVLDSDTRDFIKIGEQLQVPDIESLNTDSGTNRLVDPLRGTTPVEKDEQPVDSVKQHTRTSSQANTQQKQSDNDQSTPAVRQTSPGDVSNPQQTKTFVSSESTSKHSIEDRQSPTPGTSTPINDKNMPTNGTITPRNDKNENVSRTLTTTQKLLLLNPADDSSRLSEREKHPNGEDSLAQEQTVSQHSRTPSNASTHRQQLLDNASGSRRGSNQDKKTHSRTPSNLSSRDEQIKTPTTLTSPKKETPHSRTLSSMSNEKVIDGDIVQSSERKQSFPHTQKLAPSGSRRTSEIKMKSKQEERLSQSSSRKTSVVETPTSRKTSVVQQQDIRSRPTINRDATKSDRTNHHTPSVSSRKELPPSDANNHSVDQHQASQASSSMGHSRKEPLIKRHERKSTTNGEGGKAYDETSVQPFSESRQQKSSVMTVKQRPSITTDSDYDARKLPQAHQQQNQEKRSSTTRNNPTLDQKRLNNTRQKPISSVAQKENIRQRPNRTQNLETPTSDDDQHLPAHIRAVKIPQLNLDEITDNRPQSPSTQQIAERNQLQERKQTKKKSEHVLGDAQKKVDHILHLKKSRSSSADSHIPLADGHSVGSTSGNNSGFDNKRKTHPKKHDVATGIDRDFQRYQQKQRNLSSNRELLSTEAVRTIKPRSERRRTEQLAASGAESDTTAVIHKTSKSYEDNKTPVNINVTVVVRKVEGEEDSPTAEVVVEKSSAKTKSSRVKKIEQTLDNTTPLKPAFDLQDNNKKKSENEQHKKDELSHQPLFDHVQKPSKSPREEQHKPSVDEETKRPQSIQQKPHGALDLYTHQHEDERHTQSDSEQFITTKQQKRRRPKRISRTTQTYEKVFKVIMKEEQQHLRYTSDTEKQIQTRKSELRPRKTLPKKHFPLYLSADTFRVEDLIPRQFHQSRRSLSKSSTLIRSFSPQSGKLLILRPTLPFHHSDAVNVHRVCLQYAIDLQPAKNQLSTISDGNKRNQNMNNNSSFPVFSTHTKSAIKRTDNSKTSLPAIENDQNTSHRRNGGV
ncbi:unnamed protein product [Didymodactylos carnosus]|uniref:Uncharacterized protein n=1 Tax=Didymodactylos carnosus TaxID=1234261 RepID=A0A814ZMX4_9BILA|nr:unnamed protein product [Didymodactylos carnosus]CAF1243786.1 unnamed protein product [Didymodactylos carnosus]CAF3635885.1 unnamed protein product [Didymodactylos carnosus]CAF4008363.1 unnamed protein product [Didymodactylos carnosus]